MRKITHLIIILLVLFAGMTFQSHGQTTEQVLEKSRIALGQDARAKIEHLQTTGYLVMTGTEAKVPFKLWQTKPEKIRIETSMFGMKAIQTYDGRQAWSLNPMQGMEAVPADQEDMQFIAAATSIGGPFNKEKAARTVFSLKEKKEYKGAGVHVLRDVKSPEEHFDYYVDSLNYEVRALRYEYKKNGAWYSMEYKVEAYMNFEGAKFPSRVTVFINGVEMTSLYVTNLSRVESISEKMYMKPSY